MFNQVNLTSMDLLAPSGLFRGGATCSSQTQLFTCDSGNSGVLAGNSTGVAALAIHKSNPTETVKLAYAQSLMNDVLAHSAWFDGWWHQTERPDRRLCDDRSALPALPDGQ